MKNTGYLTISRPISNFELDGWISIELKDNKHHTILKIEVDLKEFAQTVTGLGSVNCEYTEWLT